MKKDAVIDFIKSGVDKYDNLNGIDDWIELVINANSSNKNWKDD